MVNPRTLEPNRCWCPQTSTGKVIDKHCGLHPKISYSLHSKAYITNATQRNREVLGSNPRIVSISHHTEDLKTSEHLVNPSTQESNHSQQQFKSSNKKISQKSLLKRNNIGNET